jgi:two-component system, OmpR family, sensor kinase
MPSAGGAAGRNSVRRPLVVAVAANLLVLLAVGAAGIVATVRAHNSVQYLTEHVEPAADANAAALQDLTDAETELLAWGISGSVRSLADYRSSMGIYRTDQARLDDLSDLDPQAALLVADFDLAANDWYDAYVTERLRRPTGSEALNGDLFARGQDLFADVRTTNSAVASRLQELSGNADVSVERTERNLVIALATALLVGASLTFLIGRWAGRRVTRPLGALEQTAHRLAAGEYDARAPVEGPREVVQVATAFNRMADENDRARAVEARVVEQLRALDAVKSDFVSNVSHELRTPLTSILGYLELLEEEMRDHADTSAAEMVAAAKRNVVRLGELIDDLLALTRSEARRTELAPLDLSSLVRDIVTDLRVASSQQGVDIRLGLPGTPVPVMADAGQIARVVTNLVSNAVKFSQGDSEVVVTVVADGEDAVLAVEDHGIGIPESELDQLGSRFYRASNAVGMGITGTGLGLRIVQAILENHHGSVDLRSTQGVGTTVWVRIPQTVVPEPADRPVESGVPSDPAAPAGAVG